MTTTLQERVQQALDAGFTVSQLAKAAGVTNSAASQWLSGLTKSLKAPSAIGLAQLTNWHATWWTTGLGPRERGGEDPVSVPSPRMAFRRDSRASGGSGRVTLGVAESPLSVKDIEDRFEVSLPIELNRYMLDARIQVGGMSRWYDYVSERYVLDLVVVQSSHSPRSRFDSSILRLAIGHSLDDSRTYLLAVVPLDESISVPFSLLHSITIDANLLGVKVLVADTPEQITRYLGQLELAPGKPVIEGFNDLNPAPTFGDDDQI